jgi:SAM-dependent methyltransferase
MSGRHKRDWEELAKVDPLWAVLSTAGFKGGRWELERFLATGGADVEAALATCDELGRPAARRRVLDFGCGVGRLARPFVARFEEYVGVDLAEAMVARARELHSDLRNCTFVASGASDLAIFRDGAFDLVYSNLVLQHLPDRAAVEGYVSEFLRVVRPDGIVVYQLPARLGLRQRLQSRRRLYRLLRGLGVGAELLQRRLRLHPVRLLAIPDPETRAFLERHGGTVELVTAEEANGISSRRYYVTAAPRWQSAR